MKSYSEVVSPFSRTIEAHVRHAQKAADAIIEGGAVPIFIPDKDQWGGDLFDYEGMAKAFNRNDVSTIVQRAVASADASGTQGDMIVATMQGDFLASEERAYRERHRSFVRARIHATGRHLGKASKGGVYLRGYKGAVDDMLTRAKDIRE